MTIELEDSSYDVCRHLDWALSSGVWNGRQVSWEQAPALYDEVQTRIFHLLLENQDDCLSSQFALLGASGSSRSLLAREIQEFDLKNNLVLQAGLKKRTVAAIGGSPYMGKFELNRLVTCFARLSGGVVYLTKKRSLT